MNKMLGDFLVLSLMSPRGTRREVHPVIQPTGQRLHISGSHSLLPARLWAHQLTARSRKGNCRHLSRTQAARLSVRPTARPREPSSAPRSPGAQRTCWVTATSFFRGCPTQAGRAYYLWSQTSRACLTHAQDQLLPRNTAAFFPLNT